MGLISGICFEKYQVDFPNEIARKAQYYGSKVPKLITSVGTNLHLSEFFALLTKINDDIENK